MARFMVLYNSDIQAKDMMTSSTPEQRQASMVEWIKWREDASKQVKVEFGMPLQILTRVTADGQTESDIPVGGYSLLDGDQDTIIGLLKVHPHLKRSGSSIDLLEIVPMPEIPEAK
jgi:hypothetical protein